MAAMQLAPSPRSSATRTMTKRARFEVGIATAEEREAIYCLRHDVYAAEIGQHHVNDRGRLTDALDDVNIYLVARCGGEVAGFVSLTPPTGLDARYSIDKYFTRAEMPFP